MYLCVLFGVCLCSGSSVCVSVCGVFLCVVCLDVCAIVFFGCVVCVRFCAFVWFVCGVCVSFCGVFVCMFAVCVGVFCLCVFVGMCDMFILIKCGFVV